MFCKVDVRMTEPLVDAEVNLCEASEPVMEALQRCIEVAGLSVDVCAILDRLDCTDPEDDGGGDLELSPISIAAFAYVALVHGGPVGKPQPIPPFVAAWRLADWCIKSGSLLGAFSEEYPHFAQLSLVLFSRAAKYLVVAKDQNPEDFKTITPAVRRWSPEYIFPHLLDFICTDPTLSHSHRVHLFARMMLMVRCYDWPVRAELYMLILNKAKTDQGLGRLITCFKEDWFEIVSNAKPEERKDADRQRVQKVLTSVLAGDLRLLDSMDVITSALNICKLGLKNKSLRDWFMDPSLNLSKITKALASQVDAELGMINKDINEYKDKNPNIEPSQYLLSQQLRIQLVADGVKRVRELISNPDAE